MYPRRNDEHELLMRMFGNLEHSDHPRYTPQPGDQSTADDAVQRGLLRRLGPGSYEITDCGISEVKRISLLEGRAKGLSREENQIVKEVVNLLSLTIGAQAFPPPPEEIKPIAQNHLERRGLNPRLAEWVADRLSRVFSATPMPIPSQTANDSK